MSREHCVYEAQGMQVGDGGARMRMVSKLLWLVVVVGLADCVPPQSCGPDNCTGCCLADSCEPGTALDACGTGGDVCSTCALGQLCSSGCQSGSQAGGGAGGGNGGGGATGGGPSCVLAGSGQCATGELFCGAGCCPSTNPYFCSVTNLCYPTIASVRAACGNETCVECTTPACGPGNCSGCCSGNMCVPLSGEANGSCGANGAACSACPANRFCDLVTGACHASHIEHVVLIVQENHTFETYFGMYCTAPAYSNPTCTSGPACCEGAPVVNGVYTDPGGYAAYPLDDDPNSPTSNFKEDRDHEQACELQQINGGAMDRFVTGSIGASTCFGVGPNCASSNNWVLASGQLATDPVSYYWSLAGSSALADRYFQPIAGGTSSNDMYFAGAQYRFVDNNRFPNVVVGETSAGLCVDSNATCLSGQKITYPLPTVADLLLDAGFSFAIYADGYGDALSAKLGGQDCPTLTAASGCPYWNSISYPIAHNGCFYDPSDIPFLYFQGFADQPAGGGTVFPTPYAKDLAALQQDVSAGTLPSFSFVKERIFHNEHPNMSTIADGVSAVADVLNTIETSQFRDTTLVLLTWDEGGGFFDHVAPPPSVENYPSGDPQSPLPVPYGTRVPLMAIGPFARRGVVSHVTMEHSSLVRFLEFNFLGREGGLGARDAVVNNIGSLLDPAAVGVAVPSCNSSCQGRVCGLNGCGVSCGTCPSGTGCSNGACVTCAAPGNGGCSTAGSLNCGGGQCCPAGYPFQCGSKCYATESGAAAVCGSTCTTCTPSCSLATPSSSCPSGNVSCGSVCCGAAFPYYCAANNKCYSTSQAALASPCGDACVYCQ